MLFNINNMIDISTYQTSSDVFTHVIMGDVKGKLYIPRSNQDDFLDHVCTQTYLDGFIPYGIAENSNLSEQMLTFDFDYKEDYKGGDIPEIYTDYKLNNIVFEIQKCLTTHLRLSDNPKTLDCIVLTKLPYINDSNKVKHGFHLHFLNIFMTKDDRVRLQKLVKEIIPECDVTAQNPWLMYGCCKNMKSGTYKLNRIITAKDILTSEMDIDNYLSSCKLYNSREMLIKYVEPIRWYLPRLLSTIGFKCEDKSNTLKDIVKVLKVEPKSSNDENLEDTYVDSDTFTSIVKDYVGDCFTFSPPSEEGEFVNLKRVKSGPCPVDSSFNHDKRPAYVIVNNGYVKIGCNCQVTCDGKLNRIIGRMYETEKEDIQFNPVQGIDTLFTLPQNKITHNDSNWVQDLNFKNTNCLVIKSSLGSGKTTAICRYISEKTPKRVLVLSPRRSYANCITMEYNKKIKTGKDFSCYLQIKQKSKLSEYDRLVISMESLHWLGDIIKSNPFDLLVVDECQANLNSHTQLATNGEHLETNIYIMNTLMDNSKKIVLCDAFLNTKTTNFLGDRDYSLIVYSRPMVSRMAVEIKGRRDALLSEIIESLDDNKRSYCYISSSTLLMKWVTHLRITYPNKKIISYTSESNSKGIDPNITESWVDADLVLTTSTITVGINFDVPDVFDNIYIYASSRSKNLVSDIFQSHYRVRHIKGKLYYYIDEQRNVTLDVTRYHTKKRLEWKESYLPTKLHCFESAGDQLKQLMLDNIYEYNMSIMCLRPMFNRYLQECNYVNDDSNICLDNIEIQLEKGEDSFEDKFENIRLITEFEARQIKEKMINGSALVANERMELEKKIFVSCFTQNGCAWLSKEHVGYLWEHWISYNKSRILIIRTEKKVKLGELTIKQLYERECGKCSLSALTTNKILKLEWILQLCEWMKVENSQDTYTVIPKCLMNHVYEKVKKEQSKIRNSFELRDRRSNNDEFTYTQFISLINSVFKNFGFTKITPFGPRRKKVNGKLVNVDQDYKLASVDKYDTGNIIWEYIEGETRKLLPRPISVSV